MDLDFTIFVHHPGMFDRVFLCPAKLIQARTLHFGGTAYQTLGLPMSMNKGVGKIQLRSKTH